MRVCVTVSDSTKQINNIKDKIQMKNLVLLLLLIAGTTAYSQDKNAKTVLNVDGVCGMCKARIEKASLNTKGVKYANWSIESHELKLIYDARKTVIDTIKQRILKAGHDVEEAKAPEDAYASVHPCCKYRSENVIDAHDTHD